MDNTGPANGSRPTSSEGRLRPTERLAHVMVVDDTEIDLLICKRVLTRSDRVDSVSLYANAQTALNHIDMVGRAQIDMVLLDLNMPMLGGIEFMEQICATATAETPPVLLMLSVPPPARIMKRARELPCFSGAIDKPLTQLGLLTAITRAAQANDHQDASPLPSQQRALGLRGKAK